MLLGSGLLGLHIADTGSVAGTPRSDGDNALWLGHDWVAATPSIIHLNRLVDEVRAGEFHDLFVHVGPLTDDGSWNPGLAPNAPTLLRTLHRLLPGIRLQAWLGDIVGPDRLNPDNPTTVSRIVTSAQQALNDGFDGIHYDLEPVPTADPGYLTLLAATHALTRSRHAWLSVAADQIQPAPGLGRLEQWMVGRPHWWSAGYLAAIASHVDQVALMAYDTGMPTSDTYSGYVRLETRLALRAVPPTVTLLIGLPAYHTTEPGHTDAETITAAIRGIRLALNDQSRPVGTAFYAEFTATETDWMAYHTTWVRPAR